MIDEMIDKVLDFNWDDDESFVMSEAELVEIYGSEITLEQLLAVTDSEGGSSD